MDEEGVGDSYDDETQQPAASHPVISDAQGSAADRKGKKKVRLAMKHAG